MKNTIFLLFLFSALLVQAQETDLVLKGSSKRHNYKLFLRDNALPVFSLEFGLGYGLGIADKSSQSIAYKPVKRINAFPVFVRPSYNFYINKKENPFFIKLIFPHPGLAITKKRTEIFIGTPGLGFGKHVAFDKNAFQLSVLIQAYALPDYNLNNWFVPVIVPQFKWITNNFCASLECSYLPHPETWITTKFIRNSFYLGLSLGFTTGGRK